jgi:hypothetical protein
MATKLCHHYIFSRLRSTGFTAKKTVRNKRAVPLSTSTSTANDYRKQATIKWLESIVIGQKLCPFAPPVRKAPQLRIHVSDAKDHDSIIREIEAEAHLLVGTMTPCQQESEITSTCSDQGTRPETTLVVLNEEQCPSLSTFRNLVHLSWRVQSEAIVENGYGEDLQLVLFHPQAKHDTYSEVEDAADYSIRSPFPIIHLLREVDVMKAVKSGYHDLEGLPVRNKARLRLDSLEVCAARLEACKK